MAFFNQESDNVWQLSPSEEEAANHLLPRELRALLTGDDDKENFLGSGGSQWHELLASSFDEPHSSDFGTPGLSSSSSLSSSFPTSYNQENIPPKDIATRSFCGFCKRNGETPQVYYGHKLKDSEQNVTCPILYLYTCPICRATGARAHTRQHCPFFKNESNVQSSKKNSVGRFSRHYR